VNKTDQMIAIYQDLNLIDQVDLFRKAAYLRLRRNPRRAALPGTIAGGIITFSVLIPLALK